MNATLVLRPNTRSQQELEDLTIYVQERIEAADWSDGAAAMCTFDPPTIEIDCDINLAGFLPILEQA